MMSIHVPNIITSAYRYRHTLEPFMQFVLRDSGNLPSYGVWEDYGEKVLDNPCYGDLVVGDKVVGILLEIDEKGYHVIYGEDAEAIIEKPLYIRRALVGVHPLESARKVLPKKPWWKWLLPI